MELQTEINWDIADASVSSHVDMVRTLLETGRWWTPFELCEEIWRTRGVRVSDSTVCARLRELRKSPYGSHTVSLRKRRGSRAFEYHLEK